MGDGISVVRVETVGEPPVIVYHLSNRWLAVEDPRAVPHFTLYRPVASVDGVAIPYCTGATLPKLLRHLNSG